MSGRVKIKSKVVKATLANKDVLDMFQGVLGASEGAAALPITHPKYLRIRGHVDRFIRLLTALHNSSLMTLFPGPKEHLGGYVGALGAQFSASFAAPDLAQWLPPPSAAAAAAEHGAAAEDYAKIPPEVVAQFGEIFAAAKKCSVVNTVIVACKNLVAHKKSLEDPSALKDRFLVKGAGTTFAPLPDLPQVNFKQIYIDDRLTPKDKEFVLVILHKMYAIGHDAYEAVSAPDVDVGEFAEVIMSSIDEVKKHIPRCDQAFQKIIESVDLLKGNFNDYYKDYTASGNPTIIMENFVLDVSKNTKASPSITAQFRRIIAHYRKLASQQATHPKLKSLFDQVDANFQELERKSKAADAEASDSDDSDEAEAAPVAAPAGGGKTARNRRKKAARARKAKAAAAEAHLGPADEGCGPGPADGDCGPTDESCGPGPADEDCGPGPTDESCGPGPTDEDCGPGPADEDCGPGPADEGCGPADEDCGPGLADELDREERPGSFGPALDDWDCT
jgi:hypothetical protein